MNFEQRTASTSFQTCEHAAWSEQRIYITDVIDWWRLLLFCYTDEN